MEKYDRNISILILSLKQLKGVGNKTIQKFLNDKYSQIQNTATYNDEWLEKHAGNLILKGLKNSLISWEEIKEKSEKIIKESNSKKIAIINPFMKEYPKRMLLQKNYPTLLFCLGNINLLNSEKMVAIIGTRKPTDMGKKLGLRLSQSFAQQNYTIISGLALGSDTIAHEGALNVKGHTIAILPKPLDATIYPKENQRLAETIVENEGLLVSEYETGSKVVGRQLSTNLVARDEWQATLSDGVIAIETTKRGGTNHAIRHAIKMTKPIGVFDYTSKLNDRFYEDDRFSGNIYYLQKKAAVPIFTKESVLFFEKMMREYSNKKNKIYDELNSREIESTNFRQTNLF